MNDVIIKLGLESNMLNYVDNETPRYYFLSGNADENDLQKFAKLIVKECIGITDDLVDRNTDGTWTTTELYTDYNGALYKVKRQIKEHFGVSE